MEPSVSQKVLTPPKPAQPSVSSPSSMSSTTLGTTTITTEEEMSEGEMIQVTALPSHPLLVEISCLNQLVLNPLGYFYSENKTVYFINFTVVRSL